MSHRIQRFDHTIAGLVSIRSAGLTLSHLQGYIHERGMQPDSSCGLDNNVFNRASLKEENYMMLRSIEQPLVNLRMHKSIGTKSYVTNDDNV